MRQPVLLNADLTENRRISPVAMTLTINRVPLSTASIQLTEDETIPARAWVELFTPKGSAGIFRAREPDNTYGDRIATVELEHAIAEVGNSIVAEKLEEEMPLNNAMTRLFGHYKGSVWQMATIPYTDTVTVDVDYENVLESINRLIKQTPYMMVFDFSTTPWTFWLAQTDESVTAEGRLSRNVMTGSIKYDDSNMATRAYAAYDNGEGQEALVYEDDGTAIAQYGLIEKKLNEVYANETKARAAAVKYLQSYNRPKVSISVNGEELVHITGESLDAFETGKRMRFVFDADETPIDEIIDSVRYNDLVANENDVTISMAEEDDYEYVLNELKESNRRNRSRINRINDEIHRDLWSSDGRLHSQLDLTASHLRTYFEDTAEGYWSEIEQTAEHWRSVYADAQNNLGIIEQTASYWRSVYGDAQNNLGQIEQTASYWRSTYADAQNNLGVIEQTASYWRSSYQSIGGLLGEIEQTASYWRNTYSDTANGLRAEVQQTANYWRTQLVDEGANQRSSIEQTAASLTFTADQIYLDGDTKISDILGVNSSGFLTVDGDIYQTGTIYPGGVTINRGGDLKMWTGGATGDPGSQVSLSGMDVNDMIVKADVSGNTLTLWKRGADLSASSGNRIINFSKAVTLSGAWDNGDFPLTINATQTNNGVNTNVGSKSVGFTNASDFYLTVEKNGNPTAFGNSKKLINVPFKIVHHAGGTVGDQDRYAGSLASVDATSVYNNGWEDSYGEIGLNYSSDQELSGSRKNITIYPVGKGSPSADAASIISKGITVTVPYEVTDGSIVPINFGNPPTGWTKHEFTAGESKYQYHTKDGTSGSGTNVLVYFVPRLTVDGSILNPGTDIYKSNSTIPTRIWADAYSAGETAGSNAGSAGVTLNDPTWNALSGATIPASRTVTVKTSGRKNTSGTTDNLEKTVTVEVSVDSSKAYIKHSGTTVAEIEHSYKYTQDEYNTALATVPSGYVLESNYAGYVDPVTYAAAVAGQTTAAANGYLGGWNAACSGSNPKNLAFEYNKSFTGGSASQGISVTYPNSSNGSSYTSSTAYFWLVDEGGQVGLWLGNDAGGTNTRVAYKTYSAGTSHNMSVQTAFYKIGNSPGSTNVLNGGAISKSGLEVGKYYGVGLTCGTSKTVYFLVQA